jgi:hypothetical protein
LPTVVEHSERFSGAVRQVDAPLDVHLGQKWPPIFHHDSDTLTTKADIQDGAEGQSSMSRDKLFIVVQLTIRQIFPALR